MDFLQKHMWTILALLGVFVAFMWWRDSQQTADETSAYLTRGSRGCPAECFKMGGRCVKECAMGGVKYVQPCSEPCNPYVGWKRRSKTLTL